MSLLILQVSSLFSYIIKHNAVMRLGPCITGYMAEVRGISVDVDYEVVLVAVFSSDLINMPAGFIC